MADSDLKALEFEQIRRLLERLTATPYGADAARGLEPAPDVATAQRMQVAVSAARGLLESGTAFNFSGTPDIRAALRQAAATGSVLSGTALQHVALVIALGARLEPVVREHPSLYGRPEDLVEAGAFGASVQAAVLANGQIRPEATPKLADLHRQWCEVRDQVVALLTEKLAAAYPGAGDGRDRIIWTGNRGALSVPVAVAEPMKGVRRGSAANGRDQVIEPLEVVALNNRLETANGLQEAEQAVVRRSLTDQMRAQLPGLERLLGALTWLDLAVAAARLSIQMNASPPTLTEEPAVVLDRAFHPGLLLQFAAHQGAAPVPLSLRLDPGQPMLIITGPNTGGKTVVLKTVGLLTLMAQCGLHLPSEGPCIIGSFRRIVVGIGDAQSLYHHLSTFAGHVEVLKRLMQEADANTLVLLDELGTGTDPEEGAALAMAVLDELAQRGVRALITTHLPPLRSYATGRNGVTSASMEFDRERLEPTYQLSIGTVGVSHGLTIAGRNGLPEPLIERARAYLERIATH